MLTATVSSEVFKQAQPALLYLVPFTLLPLLSMAYIKGDLRRMWTEVNNKLSLVRSDKVNSFSFQPFSGPPTTSVSKQLEV